MIDVSSLSDKYEFHNYGHALEILQTACADEWSEITDALSHFEITVEDLITAGGNKSPIPKKMEDMLYPIGWKEMAITGDLVVNKYKKVIPGEGKSFEPHPYEQKTLKGFLDGHNVDFIKGVVAFDFEWNSKDSVLDRDLNAMRTYFECGLIDVGIIITRSYGLNEIFKTIGQMAKYGASTTWMGKLIPKLDNRRQGGCPILAIGIKKECVVGYDAQTGRLFGYDIPINNMKGQD